MSSCSYQRTGASGTNLAKLLSYSLQMKHIWALGFGIAFERLIINSEEHCSAFTNGNGGTAT